MRLFPNENTGKAWDQSVSHIHLFIAKIDKLFLSRNLVFLCRLCNVTMEFYWVSYSNLIFFLFATHWLVSDIYIFFNLTVSQFTLYGVLKGNKPDFHVAMPPQKAKPFYASLVEKFQKAYSTEVVKGNRSCLNLTLATVTPYNFFLVLYGKFCADGIFGAMMKVNWGSIFNLVCLLTDFTRLEIYKYTLYSG